MESIPKEELLKFILNTIGKSIAVIIFIFCALTTIYTISFENTYCKITHDYVLNGQNTQYKSLQEIRNTEPGFYKTIYGLGTIRIAKETTYSELECKTKYRKSPYTQPADIKEQIFGE